MRITDIFSTPSGTIVQFETYLPEFQKFAGAWTRPVEQFRLNAVKDDPTIHLDEA